MIGNRAGEKVTVSPENHPKVTFAFHYLDENKLTIDLISQSGTVVKVVGNDGISRLLPQSIYDLHALRRC